MIMREEVHIPKIVKDNVFWYLVATVLYIPVIAVSGSALIISKDIDNFWVDLVQVLQLAASVGVFLFVYIMLIENLRIIYSIKQQGRILWRI